jgi:mono/diheme cytochrome c family protein
MKLRQIFLFTFAGIIFTAGLFAADVASTNNSVATAPVYVPNLSHRNEPMPDGVLAWDATLKAVDATNGQDFARFTFSFTNITAGNVTIITAPRPSCGCTTVDVPPIPWTIPSGGNGQIKAKVNLAGKSGTLFKQINVTTDMGNKNLMLRINILPPPPMPEMTEAAAKADRQAIFKGDCASCHVKNIEGKYGQQLFASICAICHEAERRATMVPDLHALKTPTNEDFWRTWIAHGKAGSLMPAFSTTEGGPLNDMQIASLAAYLNVTIPSKTPSPPQ